MSLRIYLTGRVCIEGENQFIDEQRLLGRQGRTLFVFLTAEHHRAIPRDELAEEIWPEELPPSWEKALSAIISKLRSLLGAGFPESTALTSSFGCYQLCLPADVWIDLEVAAMALDRAECGVRDGDTRHAWGWAQVTYHIARRPFLAGEDGPWVTQKRAGLRDLYMRSLECLSDVYLCTGEPALAVRHAEQAVSLEPFRETSYQRLMRAHATAGNRAEALRVYERCRRLLAEDLGVPPSPPTEALYLEILRA